MINCCAGAFDIDVTAWGGATYLAIASYRTSSSFATLSQVFQLDSSEQSFTLVQEIATFGATDVSFFTIGAVQFLAVANSRNDLGYLFISSVCRLPIHLSSQLRNFRNVFE